MAQHDGVIADQAGLAFLADLNNALMADKTLNSGATEPATKYAGMLWLDTSTTPPVLKQRNQANTDWVTLSSLIDAEVMPSPSAGGYRKRKADNSGDETRTPQQVADELSPLMAVGRNAIINGNFAVNQRAMSGTVVLAAGQYGHDRWKAGASGCTYTFATVENVTTLTISAGSLQQVIEGANLFTDTYVLSWSGTAQGKIGAGAYGASGVTGAVTGGSNLTVEFGTGTLSLVQLEPGSVATPFERRSLAQEFALCLRYFFTLVGQSVVVGRSTSVSGGFCGTQLFPVPMRAAPTITWGAVATQGGTAGTIPTGASVFAWAPSTANGSGFTTGAAFYFAFTDVRFNAEL